MPLNTPSFDYGPSIASLYAGNKCMTGNYSATSTSLTVITGLSVAIPSGVCGSFSTFLMASTNSSGGFSFTINGPSTQLYRANYQAVVGNAGGSGNFLYKDEMLTMGLSSDIASSGPTLASIKIDGSFITNAAGTLTVGLAQNRAFGTTTYLAGSYQQVWFNNQ